MSCLEVTTYYVGKNFSGYGVPHTGSTCSNITDCVTGFCNTMNLPDVNSVCFISAGGWNRSQQVWCGTEQPSFDTFWYWAFIAFLAIYGVFTSVIIIWLKHR